MILLFMLLQNGIVVEKNMPVIKPNTQTLEMRYDTFPTPATYDNFKPYVYEFDTAYINNIVRQYTPKENKTVSNVKKVIKYATVGCGCLVVSYTWLIIASIILVCR